MRTHTIIRWSLLLLLLIVAVPAEVMLPSVRREEQQTVDLATVLDQVKAFLLDLAARQEAFATAVNAALADAKLRLDADDVNFQTFNSRLAADEQNAETQASQIATLQQQVATLQAAAQASASGIRVAQRKANAGGAVTLTVADQDRLLVQCDLNAGLSPLLTDDRGTAYQQLGATVTSPSFVQAVYLSPPLAAGSISPACKSANEIYVVELAGMINGTSIAQASGTSSPATTSIAARQRDLLISFCVTWQCSGNAAWTDLTVYNGNRVAADIPVLAGNVTASFPVNHDWTLSVVAVR